MWTYSLEAVWSGLQACVASVLADAEHRHGVRPTTVGAMGVSAMMHGYLAFDGDGELLVPFRTWRNTSTERAATELSELFGHNIPLRWSVAHYHQAILDDEPHVPQVRFLTTLAGYVHWRLTGRRVLGVGDASGMFPIDPATNGYATQLLGRFDELVAETVDLAAGSTGTSRTCCPRCSSPGRTPAGSPRRAPPCSTRRARSGRASRCARPRATPAPAWSRPMPFLRAPATSASGRASSPWSSSSGRSTAVHPELDVVTTPAGDLVAMVHCNNGASELGSWAEVFGRFTAVLGHPAEPDAVFGALLGEALEGDADGGGLLAYNYLAGEPITGLTEGRPLIVRTPGSRLTLGNLMRTQVYGAFATLSLGMRVLHGEGVQVDTLLAHGGMFRTAGVAQRFLAAAVGAPVAVSQTAGEGGPWGMAVLAGFLAAPDDDLGTYLDRTIFADAAPVVAEPNPADVEGYATFLDRYVAGLDIERVAVETT